MALVFMVYLSKDYRFLLPSVILVITFFCFTALSNRMLFIFEAGGDARRFSYWHAACLMIKENPFLGKGLGTFMDYFPRYKSLNTSYAHNCFLQIWAESGIFSILSFLSFLILLFRNSIKSFYNNRDYVILGFLGGAFGFLSHAFFENHLYSLQLSVLFWLWIAILSAGTVLNKESSNEDRG